MVASLLCQKSCMFKAVHQDHLYFKLDWTCVHPHIHLLPAVHQTADCCRANGLGMDQALIFWVSTSA